MFNQSNNQDKLDRNEKINLVQQIRNGCPQEKTQEIVDEYVSKEKQLETLKLLRDQVRERIVIASDNIAIVRDVYLQKDEFLKSYETANELYGLKRDLTANERTLIAETYHLEIVNGKIEKLEKELESSK